MKVAWIVGILMAFSFISLASASCNEGLCNEEDGTCCGSVCCYGTCINEVCSQSSPPPGGVPSISGTFNAGDTFVCGNVIGNVVLNEETYIVPSIGDCPFGKVCGLILSTNTDGCFGVTANSVTIDGKNKRMTVDSSLRFTKGVIYTTSSISNLQIKDIRIRYWGHAAASAAINLNSVTTGSIKNSELYVPISGSRRSYGIDLYQSSGITIDDVEIQSPAPVRCISTPSVAIKDSDFYILEGESGGISTQFAVIGASSCSSMSVTDTSLYWEGSSTGSCIQAVNSNSFSYTRSTCESDGYGIFLSGSGASTINTPYITSENWGIRYAGYSINNILRFLNGNGYIRTNSRAVVDQSTGSPTMSTFMMMDSNAQVEWLSSAFKGDFKIDGDIEFGGVVTTASNYLELDGTGFTLGGYTQIKTTPILVTLYEVPTSTFTTPVIFRDNVKCDGTTTPACTSISGLSPPVSTVSWQVPQFSNYTIGDEGEGSGVPGGHNDTELNIVAGFGEGSKYEMGAPWCNDEEDELQIYIENLTNFPARTFADPYDSTLHVTIPYGSATIVDGPAWDGMNYYCNLSLGTDCNFTIKANSTGTGVFGLYIYTMAGGGYAATNLDMQPIHYAENCSWIHAVPRDGTDLSYIIPGVVIALLDENQNPFYSLVSGEYGAYFVGITARDMNVTLNKLGYLPALYLVEAHEFDAVVNFTMTVDPDYVPPTIDCPWCFAEAPPTKSHEATGGLLNIVTQGVLPGMFVWLMLFIIAIIAFAVIGKLLITGVS
jgi:hypothetical protein